MNHLPLTTPSLLEVPEWITPLLLLSATSCGMLLQQGKHAAEGAAWVARLFFAGAVILAGGVMLAGPMRLEFAAWGPASLALLVDPLSALMLLAGFEGCGHGKEEGEIFQAMNFCVIRLKSVPR